MAIRSGILIRGTVWTILGFGVGQVIRLSTSIALSHLLMPELFGIMAIINTIRNGFVLISDFGIGQNIISNKNAFDPEFYNTARTAEALRNVILCLICIGVSGFVANFYNVPSLGAYLSVASLTLIPSGLASPGQYLAQKRMLLSRITLVDLSTGAVNASIAVILAWLLRNVWSQVIAGLFSAVISMLASYIIIKDVKFEFAVSKRYFFEILQFSRWIFLSSISYFIAMNIDRLYMAKITTLTILGIYGIARSIAELIGGLFARLGSAVVLPFVAAHVELHRLTLAREISGSRLKFLLLCVVGYAFAVTGCDLVVKLAYDERYRDAVWMVPILMSGTWFTILTNLNESILVGLGKPAYSAISHTAKCVYLAILLPTSLYFFGVAGCICVVSAADIPRYIAISYGQRREKFSFLRQDVALSALAVILIALLEYLRGLFGFGFSPGLF